MKKLLTMAGMAAVCAVVFCTTSAKALPSWGLTTNYDTLNLTMTVQYSVEGTGSHYLVVKSKTFDNHSLLELLSSSDFAGEDLTNIGAKLVISWDAGFNVTNGTIGDILVVDKTGTNVLYDASAGWYNDTLNNGYYVYLDLFKDDYGAVNYTDTDADPGHVEVDDIGDNAEFAIYDDGDYYLDFEADGPDTIDVTQNWNKDGDYSGGSESETASVQTAGYDITSDETYTTIKVHISASGHPKGIDDLYYYDYDPLIDY